MKTFEELGLSTRAVDALTAALLTRTEDIVKHTEAQLLSIDGIGRAVVEELKMALVDAGLELATVEAQLEAELKDRLHPILSNEEVETLRARARTQLEAEQKKSAEKQFLAEETQRLRREEGLSVGGAKDEMVSIKLDLAPHSACLNVDGRPYWHNQTYELPRHIADSLREQMQRGWQHQNQIEGKTTTEFYQRAKETHITATGGVKNSPVRP